MTAAQSILSRFHPTPWGQRNPPARRQKQVDHGSGFLSPVWVAVNLILAIIATFTITYNWQVRKFESTIRTQMVTHGQLSEATRGAEKLKAQLSQASVTMEELIRKSAGSDTIINNLTRSRQQLAAQMEENEKLWRNEKLALQGRINELEKRVTQMSARSASLEKSKGVQGGGTVDQTVGRVGSDLARSVGVAGAVERSLMDQARTIANSSKQVGCVEGECTNGHGAWRFDNGEVYVGAWYEGAKNGQGLYRYASGATYFGDWSGDLKQGHGIYQFANGTRFDGEWVRGQRHGPGVELHANGTSTAGRWFEGRRVP